MSDRNASDEYMRHLAEATKGMPTIKSEDMMRSPMNAAMQRHRLERLECENATLRAMLPKKVEGLPKEDCYCWAVDPKCQESPQMLSFRLGIMGMEVHFANGEFELVENWPDADIFQLYMIPFPCPLTPPEVE